MLSIILIVAVLGAFGALSYVIATPDVEESFTEFYLLNLNDKADDYSGLLAVGERGEVVVGIINKELGTAAYRLEMRINGLIDNEVGPVTLRHNERWQEIVGFTPDRMGEK